jgi:hypothetical protein
VAVEDPGQAPPPLQDAVWVSTFPEQLAWRHTVLVAG